MGDDQDKVAEATKLPARTAAQRLKHVKHLALPDLEEMRAQVAQLAERVDKKLEGLPPERLIDPPATISAPAALQYALLGDSDEVRELREMFENLLASSMNRAIAGNAHPAFVSMISQLTPDEARILKSIDRGDYALVKAYQHQDFDNDEARMFGETTRVFETRLGADAGIDCTRLQQYVSNLERLGILRVSERAASKVDEYDALYTASAKEVSGRGVPCHNGSIRVTALGREFLDTCVRPRAWRRTE